MNGADEALLPNSTSPRPSHRPSRGAGLQLCEQPRKAGEIQNLLGVRHRQTSQENYLNVFLDKGWLARTIPDKPQSRLQRYHTTQEGKRWLQTAATRSGRPPVSAS